MGAGASTVTKISNEYNFSGNNNGITSGDQGVYGTTTGASTDVKPTSDMNYSPQINPDFGQYLKILGSGNRAKLIGVVSKTANVIDSVRHIGAAAYRVAMGDDDLIDKAKKLVNDISSIDNSDDVLSGQETIPVDLIKSTSDLQLEVVRRLPEAHDAYAALALGMTGMRNAELSTRPTARSVAACFERASEGEKLNADNIIALSGPRMGVIPKNASINSSTIIQETLDNTVTEHGSVGELKKTSDILSGIQRNLKCSILHASSAQLSEAQVLPTDSWETKEIIGMIRQHSVPIESGSIFPGGMKITTSLSKKAVLPKPIDDDNNDYGFICPTSQAYELPNDISNFRDTYMILNGRVAISNQPWPGVDPVYSLHIGIVYLDSDNIKRFAPAYFINSNEFLGGQPQEMTSSNLLKNKEILLYKRKLAAEEPERVMSGGGSGDSKQSKVPITLTVEKLFSFDSAFQLIVNLSKTKDIWTDQIFETPIHNVGPFKGLLVLALRKIPDHNIDIMISVESPTVRIETIANPEHMVFMGARYSGSIIDLIATVPEWYTSGDHHDPIYLYKKFLEPVIPYLGRIADAHLANEGAALQLSRDHIIRAYNKGKGSRFTMQNTAEIDAFISKLIISLHEALYITGPFKGLLVVDRKIVFMHFLEKVVTQSLTHIHVWRDRTVSVRDHYARDCRDFNAIELEMDKKRTDNQC